MIHSPAPTFLVHACCSQCSDALCSVGDRVNAADPMSIELLVALLVCVSIYIATLAACRTELQSMKETRTYCRRQVTKPKRKLVMILTAANDFFSDALYVSTATFVSPGLQAAAILFFVLPTVVFCVVGRDFMKHLAVGLWAFYKRKVHGDDVALQVATFEKAVLWLIRAVVWGAVLLAVAPVWTLLAINCKLFALQRVASAVARESGDEATTMTVTAVNLSVLFELVLESVPQFCIALANQRQSGESAPTFVFYYTAISSLYSFLSGIWPIAWWWYHKKSLMEAMNVKLYDDWECNRCKHMNSVANIRCTYGECGGKHPDFGHHSNVVVPFSMQIPGRF